MPALAPNPEPDPDPFFDPAEFFCHHQAWTRAAEELHDGDIYRKAVLGLDEVGVALLRAALAPHNLLMVDAGDDWVFVDSRVAEDHLPVRQCTFGQHAATGPTPWCCLRRRAYVLQYRSAKTERPAFGVVYVEPDQLDPGQVLVRVGTEACAVCGVRGPACQCRWCAPCSRYWGAATDAQRTDAKLHHGVLAETCPACRGR